jgi:hypothetical protein
MCTLLGLLLRAESIFFPAVHQSSGRSHSRRLGMTKQSLNRLYVFALVDKKGRKGVTEIAEAESLAGFEPDAKLNRGGANFKQFCHTN